MTPQEIRERLAKIGATLDTLAQTIATEGRGLSAEERASYEAMVTESNNLRQSLEIHAQRSQLETDLNGDRRIGRNGPPPANRQQLEPQRRAELEALAIQGWFRRQSGMPRRREHIEAARQTGIGRGNTLELRLNQRPPNRLQRRDMGVADGATGGYLVPEGFVSAFERTLLDYSGVRQAADVMRTSTGADLPWPTVDDTSNEGEIVEENAPVDTETVAVDRIVLGAFKFGSKLIAVSHELIEDNAVNLVQVLGELIGERIGRRQNRAFTVGTGTDEPTGLLTSALVGNEAEDSTSITYADLVKLQHSVDRAYRPGASWMMNDAILMAIRLLVDENGRPIFQDAANDMAPARLMGYPIYFNAHMPDALTAEAKVMTFGDHSKCKIRDVNTIRIRRLVEHLADKDQEGFVGFLRSDFGLLIPSAVKSLQMDD